MDKITNQVLTAFKNNVFYTPHALHQMNSPDRLINRKEVEEVILQGEVIESYSEDARGQSCLMMKEVSTGRVIHVVCAPKKEYLTIITAYLPNEEQWENDMKTRKKG